MQAGSCIRCDALGGVLRILVSGGVVGVQYAKYDLVCDFRTFAESFGSL